MREILTILAGLLVLILTIAFVGPYLVDWTAHRDWVEAQLSDATGARVRVEGPIDITLLPTPRLSIERVKIAFSDPTAPTLDAAAMRLELSVTPLMRGELRFTDADIDSPRLNLTLRPDGAFAVPEMPEAPPDKIGIDHLRIRNGSLTINDLAHSRSTSVDQIDLDAEATSLTGPFKGSGQFGDPSNTATFRFTTGVKETDRMRLKLIVDETKATPRMDVDGALLFAATRVSYSGPAVFSATFRGVPWRATGALTADSSAADLRSLELRAGSEDKALNVAGSARIDFGARPRIILDLNARQIDLDRLFGDDASSPQRFGDAVGSLLTAPDLHLPMELSVSLASPAMTLAGDTLSQVSGDLSLQEGHSAALRLEASGPGRSHLLLDGSVETGLAAKFAGKIDASVREMARFEDWVGAISTDVAGRMKNLPMRALDVSGAVDFSGAGFSGRNLTIKADRSTFTGSLAFTRAVGDDRARLFADLNSPALDLDGVPSLTGPASAATGVDLALTLDARAIRLARFGDGVVDAGRISLRLSKAGDDVRLENFAIANLGGAALSASGSLGKDGTRLDAQLDATRLVDLADLVKRVAPGPIADALSARAVALSPARFNLKLAAPNGSGDDLFRLGTVAFDASARGTTIRGTARPDAANPSNLQASATIEAPEAASLLRQIGLDVVPLSGAGRGRIVFAATGNASRGLDATISASLAGTDMRFSGTVGSAAGTGDLTVRSANLMPLLQIVGVSSPDPTGAAVSMELATQVIRRGPTIGFSNLLGRVDAANLSGDLALAPKAAGEGAAGQRLTGTLQLDQLSFGNLAALAFGPATTPRAGAVWSDARFPPALASPPDTDIGLSISRLDLSNGLTATDARLRLGLTPGAVTLTGVQLALSGGGADGSIVMRRDGAVGSLSGHVQFKNIAIARPSLTGRLEGAMDFTATGGTPLALVSGLAGGGRVSVHDLRAPGADPGAIDRVVALAEKDVIPAAEPDVKSALGLEFSKGTLTLGERAFEANLGSGALKLAPIENASSNVALQVDLRTMAVEQKIAVSGTPPPDWTDAAPQATIIWKGPLNAPTRTIDAASLGNALSTRAITREMARVQALEADIRERAFFNRRLKGVQYMRQRDQEIAAYEAEQARLAAEEARRRAAEAARLEREERAREQAEAARIERERRAAEAAQVRQPPPAPPPASPRVIAPPPAMLVPGAIDPSASGRY